MFRPGVGSGIKMGDLGLFFLSPFELVLIRALSTTRWRSPPATLFELTTARRVYVYVYKRALAHLTLPWGDKLVGWLVGVNCGVEL